MTAIASFSLDRCPIIFGDLLISGPTERARNIHTPAAGNVEELFHGSGWGILGLRQKVVIINKYCALAWSGSYPAAKVAVEELREISQKAALSGDGIRAFLSTHAEVKKHGVSFVGWAYEEDTRKFVHIRHNTESVETGMGKIFVGGSGAYAIKDFASAWNTIERQETGDINPLIRASHCGLAMANLLLQSEFYSGINSTNLLSFFGGGYEVAVFLNGSFTKIGNFNHLFWRARLNNDELEIHPPQLIIKQCYFEDILLLKSVKIADQSDPDLSIEDEQAHAIFPLYDPKSRTLPDMRDISYQSNLLCHSFLIEKEGVDSIFTYTRLQQTGVAGTPTIKFHDSDSKLHLAINNKFIDDVANSILEKFKSSY